MKSTLLIEIGVEEIPASYLQPAVKQLSEIMQAVFESAHIEFDEVRSYYTPRRFALIFENIDERGKATVKRVHGPPQQQAFDDKGTPTKAAVGFARSMKKKTSDIKIGERKGKRVCYIEKKEKSKLAAAVVKESLAESLLNIYFPKKMRWEKTGFEFARPIRWIALLLGGKPLRTTIAGISSSNMSYGPRFMGSKKIKIDDASDYEKIMRHNHVMVSFEERREKIKRDMQSLLGRSLRISDDEALLDEVANLVEYPTAFRGSFDQSFLEMSKNVLVTAMKEHQRYFAILNAAGEIKPFYIGISNGLDTNIDTITKGHNSVLRARLSDAQFYWIEDLKTPFAERIEELKGVEWHRGLGTVYDKSKRLVELSLYLCQELGKGSVDIVKRGALLSKADVVTNMIKDGKEFTTLEGIIGKEYALRSNEKKEVAEIIAEHHLPRFPEDDVPTSSEACIVGIADRIDTLTGNFLIGEIPSGSFDPFGLRRCVNGLLRIVDSFSMRFNLEKAVDRNIDLFRHQKGISIKLQKKEAVSRLFEFIGNRLSSYVSNMGTRYDIASAVMAVPYNDLFDIISRIRCLNNEKEDTQFEELIVGQRRVSNILQGIEDEGNSVDNALFDCDEERKLWCEFGKTKDAFKRAMEKYAYAKAIRALLSLRSYIDDFFDSCLVMDKDEKKRGNRIRMLMNIKKLFNKYADFSLIVLEGERDKTVSG